MDLAATVGEPHLPGRHGPAALRGETRLIGHARQVTCGCTTRYTTRAAPRYCCCTAARSTSTSSSANCYPGNSTTRQPPRRPPEIRSSTGLDNISEWPNLNRDGHCLANWP